MDVDAVIVGAGISGLATLKTLLEIGLRVIIVEATDGVAGLWRYTRDGYGVTSFTHINICKYNYCFSDHPFPPETIDFPHHSDMHRYVMTYVERFDLAKHILFKTKVKAAEQNPDESWTVTCVSSDNDSGSSSTTVVRSKTLVVASGHHAKPCLATLKGQDTFKGVLMHSVAFKNATVNDLVGKKVVIVGIGNSAMDTAVHLAETNGYEKTIISTRSGAWVVPNYIFGYPIDLHVTRTMLAVNWRVIQAVLEALVYLHSGSPWKWNLNPKFGVLQTHPTVSPTLVHHIQRGKIKVVANVKEINGNRVKFEDGNVVDDVDAIILCTGYKIDLPFFSQEVSSKVLREGTNATNLFENVFCPEIGKSLAFIGFIQPASSGLISMVEVQAQWLGQVIRGSCHLPSVSEMKSAIAADEAEAAARYHASSRHTIQRDPLIYNDRVASYYGAKPQLWKHPLLSWRLVIGSGSTAQWRLQGPYKWGGAAAAVRAAPVPPLCYLMYGLPIAMLLFVFLLLLFWIVCALC